MLSILFSSSASSLDANICTNRTFIGAIFNRIVIILSEIGSHITTDFTTSSLTITPTPLLFFSPPEKNTLYLYIFFLSTFSKFHLLLCIHQFSSPVVVYQVGFFRHF